MIKNAIILIVFTFFSLHVFSQSSQISDGGGVIMLIDLENDKNSEFERGSYSGDTHVLGDSITSLLDKVERTYVYYKETGGAYGGKEKNFEKPIIYSSLSKVIRHYDKMLRKEKIEPYEARQELFEILNNGIALKNYQTQVFEEQLKATKNKAELARLFQTVRLQN